MNDESDVERVLRAAGGRDQPSEALERHVRAAVHAEWRAAVAQRRRQRRVIWFAAAASIVIAALGLWASRFVVDAPRGVVANVSRVDGSVSSRERTWAFLSSWQRWQALQARQSLAAGEDVMTGRDGRAALTFAGGISLRLDRDTRVALTDAEHIEVLGGAVYVDAGATPAGGTHPLRIGTPAGAVRHLGTQYEVRLLNSGVRIRVREGRVELSNPSGVVERVHAGEQLTVAASGDHQRTAIAPSGMEWNWAIDIAPAFDIESRSLRDFLTWIGRELGKEIAFVTPASEAEAAGAMLHGSVAGLTPAEALDAVLLTTKLRRSRRDDDRIVIELQ